MPHLQVRQIRFDNGERYPVLQQDCMPMFFPCVYVTSMLRVRNLAYATLLRHLQSIKQLYAWAAGSAAGSQIDIEARIRRGEFFEEHEIDAIVRACRAPYQELVKLRKAPKPKAGNIIRLESFRQKSAAAPEEVQGQTAANRVHDIRDYLDWLASVMMPRISRDSDSYMAFQLKREQQKQGFNAKMPKPRESDPKEGLDRETADRLMQVVNPDSPDNPWPKDRGVALRNQCIIQLLYTLGIRRGELLGIKTTDFNSQAGELTIHRRPDDPDDPRRDKPRAKTRARRLDLEHAVIDLVLAYITTVRRNVPNAKKNLFLFVTHKKGRYQGKPLSISAYHKIIEKLRETVPELPENVSGHILRHSWNERFSEICDSAKTPEEKERSLREYLMGWKSGSAMARRYTERHTREAAKKASLALQKGILDGQDE